MYAAASEASPMGQRRTAALLAALALGALAAGAAVPPWLHRFLASAAWFLGTWLLVSVAAALVAVRWFRARARANELITPEGREVSLPGEPATK
jgi:hypothetical protein